MKFKNYMNTTSYNAIIELPEFDAILYNHGTESKVGTRTGGHKRSCEKQGFNYEVIDEKADDRLFGRKVISRECDAEYAKRLTKIVNEENTSNSRKAYYYKDWLDSLPYGKLTPKQKRTLDALEATDLSFTECTFIPNSRRQDLPEAIKKVNKWYYTDESIRVSVKESKASSENSIVRLANGEKNVCRPIQWQYHKPIKRLLNKILNNNKLKLLIKRASIQSLLLAYALSFELLNAKIRVIVVADDREKNKELYNVMNEDSRFELIDCESDADVEDIYMNDTKDFDLIIGNPPYAIGNQITRAIVDTIDFDVFVNLMPVSKYKAKELYKNVSSIESIEDTFEDAAVGDSLTIAVLKKDANVYKSYQELEFMKMAPQYVEFYRLNSKCRKHYQYIDVPKIGTILNPNYDFQITMRTPQNGVHKIDGSGANDIGWNINKDITSIGISNWGECYSASFYRFDTVQEFDHLSRFWYYNSLMNDLIKGMKKSSGSSQLAIPNIDWSKERDYEHLTLDDIMNILREENPDVA